MDCGNIVDRIISDAKREAEEIVAAAEKKAEEILAQAKQDADRKFAGVKAETAQKAKAISDGKAATARLDGQKAELKEKRRVVDAVYGEAQKRLCALPKKEALYLADRLLSAYAEEGDSIVFAQDYPYAADVAKSDVFKEKKLKVSHAKANVDGGFILLGKTSDKDVSYAALLAADREERQAQLAADVFKG